MIFKSYDKKIKRQTLLSLKIKKNIRECVIFYIRMRVLREVCLTEILKGPTGKASEALPSP